ncbi:hypothetical protein NECAME_01633 [Necator americanus]|uniref:Reverse transcriptase domain-containing protein n=1 Tax=Necator americanus TaxID=51031 RepID=W2TTN0_NECAM|nr:hypothetical protein NECAME_01633 [Necator americanus]ETN84407.1 hypothetical protein NECAME_01633 [Necator americanus]
MKAFERVLEARPKKIVSASPNQCGLAKDCSTMDAVRILLEKHREKNRGLDLAFLVLEKAFDRVPHELLWMCMRSPRTLLFADDVVLASESRDDPQKQVQSWTDRLQQHGLHLNVSKSEYMECGPRIEDGSIRVNGNKLKKVDCFKHLECKVTSTGDIDKKKVEHVLMRRG